MSRNQSLNPTTHIKKETDVTMNANKTMMIPTTPSSLSIKRFIEVYRPFNRPPVPK